MTDMASARESKILDATERMTQLIAENAGASNLWKAQVRQAHGAVQLAIETLADAGDLAGLQALDVAAHAAWPAAPA